jgi:phosphoribosylamine--glycine ligase/phosphoribosylaminoimidazole synthetase
MEKPSDTSSIDIDNVVNTFRPPNDTPEHRLAQLNINLMNNLSKHLIPTTHDPLVNLLVHESCYRVLIVGCGAREHAIVEALVKSKFNIEIYNVGSHVNPGIAKHSRDIKITNHLTDVVSYAKSKNIYLAIIGPEEWLAIGTADELSKVGVKCFGPTKNLATLESNKAFARQLVSSIKMNCYQPKYRYFISYEEDNIKSFIKELNYNFVVKACGLCRGKGVKVMGIDINSVAEALTYCHKVIQDKSAVIIEEKLYGDEFTLMSFVDGTVIKSMPVVKDYKRLSDGDTGSQTGGMGCISMPDHSMPFLTTSEIQGCNALHSKVINEVQTQFNETYCGILYGSYMKTKSGEIKLIEFNCRFGDPEAVILSIMRTDFMEVCLRTVNKLLGSADFDIYYENKSVAAIYMVPSGYPYTTCKNWQIYVDDNPSSKYIVYGAVNIDTVGKITLTSSRSLLSTGTGDSLETAILHAKKHLKLVHGPLENRSDIGSDILKYNTTVQINYDSAGVSLETAEKLVDTIRESVESTFTKCIKSKHGDFCALAHLKGGNYTMSVDGVGTKPIIVREFMGKEGFHSLGKDLFYAVSNDCLVKGSLPLIFLDYFASAIIDLDELKYFVSGISSACKKIGCSLVGGETAEMPGVYAENRHDMVGMCIGHYKKKFTIDSEKIMDGNMVIGMTSSGPHTNGYSLIRKILAETSLMADFMTDTERQNFIKFICNHHSSYFEQYIAMCSAKIKINGMVHITGGGLLKNPPRILPQNLKMEITVSTIPIQPEFMTLKKYGNLSDTEMLQTFNCGIGMMLIINKSQMKTIEIMARHCKWIDMFHHIGYISNRKPDQPQVIVHGKLQCREIYSKY